MSIAGDDARIRGMREGGGSRASIVIKADREEKEGGFPCQRHCNQIANTQQQKKDHVEKQLAVVMVDGGGVR